MNSLIYAIICSSFLLFNHLTPQSKIEFTNPSLEGDVAYSSTPKGWNTCKQGMNSPPDIHNGKRLVWKNTQKPASGKSYVGLVLRQDGVVEHIGTELPAKLKQDKHYAFTIKLSIPEVFTGKLRNNQIIEFTDPVALEVWGSNSDCKFGELLHTTDVIHNTQWKKHKIHINPKEGDYKWIHLIPRYINDKPYNAALLVDGLSSIYRTDSLYNFNPEHFDAEEVYQAIKKRNKDADAAYSVINDYYVQEIIKSSGNVQQVLLYDFTINGEYTIHKMHMQKIHVKDGMSKTFDIRSNRMIHQKLYENGKAVKGSMTMNGYH